MILTTQPEFLIDLLEGLIGWKKMAVSVVNAVNLNFFTNRHRFTPTIKSFCKLNCLKVVYVCQKATSQLSEMYSLYEEKPEEFWDETDVDSFFTSTNSTSPSPSIEYYALAKTPKNSLFQSSFSNFAI